MSDKEYRIICRATSLVQTGNSCDPLPLIGLVCPCGHGLYKACYCADQSHLDEGTSWFLWLHMKVFYLHSTALSACVCWLVRNLKQPPRLKAGSFGEAEGDKQKALCSRRCPFKKLSLQMDNVTEVGANSPGATEHANCFPSPSTPIYHVMT